MTTEILSVLFGLHTNCVPKYVLFHKHRVPLDCKTNEEERKKERKEHKKEEKERERVKE